MPRPGLLSQAALDELARQYEKPGPHPSFRALAAHLRDRRLVAKRIDPRVVWRAIRKRFPRPEQSRGAA